MARDVKSRVRLMLVELEASDKTLEESIRTLASAINAPRVSSSNTVQPLPKAMPTPTWFDDVPEEDGEGAAPRRSNSTSRKRKVKTPVVMNDLGFDQGRVTLSDFADGYKTDSDQSKYLVVVAWFRDHGDKPTINSDHVYNAYRSMDWTVPDEPGKPLRNLKSQKWLDGSEGNYSLNHIGENKLAKIKAVAAE